jgi:hypothetical protein
MSEKKQPERKRCEWCDTVFLTTRPTRRKFCSGKCRFAKWALFHPRKAVA